MFHEHPYSDHYNNMQIEHRLCWWWWLTLPTRTTCSILVLIAKILYQTDKKKSPIDYHRDLIEQIGMLNICAFIQSPKTEGWYGCSKLTWFVDSVVTCDTFRLKLLENYNENIIIITLLLLAICTIVQTWMNKTRQTYIAIQVN